MANWARPALTTKPSCTQHTPVTQRLPDAGHVLRRLGLPIALSVLPASAGVLLTVIAAWPAPTAVAAAEVCRKLLAYSLARPARESLYTVLSRDEKCELAAGWKGFVAVCCLVGDTDNHVIISFPSSADSAKLFLDTVVQVGSVRGCVRQAAKHRLHALHPNLFHPPQRIGDTTAAALFQTLVPALGFGPSELAMAVVPVTAAWAATAYSLGRRQQQLARTQFLAE